MTTSSTSWLRNGGMKNFGWQDDYGAFSVSPENVDRVIRYIKNQEEYHRHQTFEEEYREILRKCDGNKHKVDVHLVFSTKNRVPFLADKTVRLLLHGRLAKICKGMDCPSRRIGGIEDHVHILYRLSQERSLAQVTLELKTSSTPWLVTEHDIRKFDWQDGYGAFSVSPQHISAVMSYIENQEDHHRKATFEDEYDRLHRNHGLTHRSPVTRE